MALAYDSARSRYLATWKDGRNGALSDIYAQLAKGYTTVVEYEYDPLYSLTNAH